MKQTQLKRWFYHLRYRYLTTNTLVMIVALFIAAGWAWGSVGVLQRNYTLQREIDTKQRELTLLKLQTQNLAFQQRYYQSDEYRELAVRQRLGLAFPGEKAFILPPNSAAAAASDKNRTPIAASRQTGAPSNMQQWVDFLFGSDRK